MVQTELTAMRAAPYSRSPRARAIQIMTMPMQREQPTRLKPAMKPASSWKKAAASRNMRNGPATQFCAVVSSSSSQSRNTAPTSSQRTFASGGYIMASSPAPTSRFMLPIVVDSMKECTAESCPRPMPAPADSRIHSGRKRSSTDNWPAMPPASASAASS